MDEKMGENIQKIVITYACVCICVCWKRAINESERLRERDNNEWSEVIKAKEIATLLFLLQPK